MPDGVVIFWMDEDDKKFETFGFSDLIDMRINTLDLITNPQNYQFNPEEGKISFTV
jgi:hypothetical protein